MKNRLYFLLVLIAVIPACLWAGPVEGLLERIDKGASKKFVIELKKGANDFFELDQKGSKVVVRGNKYSHGHKLVFEVLCRHSFVMEWHDSQVARCVAACYTERTS